ncbi:MAG: 50S ribosomal protein L4 [Patescibacteria group bacterium]
MKIDVFNKQNNKVETIDLSEKVFGVRWNSDLVHQALLTQLANSRAPLAHTKGRGEVRGGGKKPWRQKGTGRSRHGSIRSPLWAGGGVTHGPTKEEVFSKKINKKMKRLAIFSILSKKIKDQELKVIDKFNIEDSNLKTKKFIEAMKNIIDNRSKYLFIAASENKAINRITSNIKNIKAISGKSLNARDLLNCKNIILEKDAINEIEKQYQR